MALMKRLGQDEKGMMLVLDLLKHINSALDEVHKD